MHFYVAVPGEVDPLPGRNDPTPGAISFFDPRPQANMTAIRHDPQIDPEHRVQPAAGTRHDPPVARIPASSSAPQPVPDSAYFHLF